MEHTASVVSTADGRQWGRWADTKAGSCQTGDCRVPGRDAEASLIYPSLKQPSKAPEGDRVFEKLRPPRLIALFQQRIIAVGTGSMSPQPECIDGGSRFPKGREWAAVGGSKDWGK